jgi:hypothetical protein
MKTFDKQRIYRVVMVFQPVKAGDHPPRLVIDNLTEREARDYHTMLVNDWVTLDTVPASNVEWGITP